MFREDAGALAAWLVDAETGELHPGLSTGQRAHDLMIASENVAGELLDLEAGGKLRGEPGAEAPELEAAAVGDDLVRRYEALWAELTREELICTDEQHLIAERVQRLNELGFDVSELELVGDDEHHVLRVQTRVVEPGHHRRRLLALTGLDAGENQARVLLNDIVRYRARAGAAGQEARGRARRGGPLAGRSVRAHPGHGPGRSGVEAGAGRAVPPHPPAPLVPVGGPGRRRRARRTRSPTTLRPCCRSCPRGRRVLPEPPTQPVPIVETWVPILGHPT